jgi:hypothetical protein
MPQTILSVILEVEPPSEGVLRDRIKALRSEKVRARERLSDSVPALHFMSLTVFKDDLYDPILVLEANFDGPPGPFWGQLEAALGAELRDMLRCCRPPRDKGVALFKAVTQTGSRAPIAPLLEARTVMPAARHQGNRGLDRDRIRQEGWLFAAAQEQFNTGQAKGARSAAEIHDRLRAALLPSFWWLNHAPLARIGKGEQLADWCRLVAFVLVALSVFLLPPILLGILVGESLSLPGWATAVLATVTVLVMVGMFVLAFRLSEIRDPSQDEPLLDADKLRAMAQLEDSIAQNHMISLVHIKPGIVRAIVARVTLAALGLWVRANARSGYLQSMRTIHFAHWALVSNGSRLMFHSNFDGSWESYLDDFIEKAHGGLTAAWTHGVGFPRTKWLIGEGATSGGKFKAWGRHSMNVSQFWYSAYPDYSVNQIERHARVAQGLRKATLTDKEADAWALDL